LAKKGSDILDKPFVIAEMSGNHNQSLERALKIVEVAASCGVNALKIQTYTPDSLTLNINNKKGFFIEDKNSIWFGRTCYEVCNTYIPASPVS
jgi:N-acetylneuraminate synthase